MFKFKALVLPAAAALGLSVVSVAGAQSSEAPKYLVRYSSRALESEAGVRHLYHQLLVAAEKVCPQAIGWLPSTSVLECRRQAVAGAVEKIHNTRLATISGQSQPIG